MTARSCYSFDTNILVYAADWRAGRRHEVATDLLIRAVGTDCVLTLQSLSEFFHVTTRKGLLSVAEAVVNVDDWRKLFRVVAADESALPDAIAVVRDHGLSFWDAMLWATVRRAGCGLLVTEDLQDGRSLGGVRFVNPFGETLPQALVDALGSN
jgi:predicted nucleic acid-binding protein